MTNPNESLIEKLEALRVHPDTDWEAGKGVWLAMEIVRQHTAAPDAGKAWFEYRAECKESGVVLDGNDANSFVAGFQAAIAAMATPEDGSTAGKTAGFATRKDADLGAAASEVTYSYKAPGDTVMTPELSSETRVVDDKLLDSIARVIQYDFGSRYSLGTCLYTAKNIGELVIARLRQPVEPVSLEKCVIAAKSGGIQRAFRLEQYAKRILDFVGVNYVD